MTADQIKQIQFDLARMGYYKGQIDGIWGPQSVAAWSALAAPPKAPTVSSTPRNLEQQLRRDEGEVLYYYPDHLGYATIGVGRLIDKRKGGGITQEESAYLLRNDIAKVSAQVAQKLPWSAGLDEARRGVLINMAFQMGIDGLLGFKNTLELIQTGQYGRASAGMLQSLWAKQTPERAKRMSQQMATGQWQ